MVFTLGKSHRFPDVHLANEDGLLAFGGDVDVPRLLEAYTQGIFPWPDNCDNIFWYAPDPRYVILTEHIYISKSMRKLIRNETFNVTYNQNFKHIIQQCAKNPRPYQNQSGTWLFDEMIHEYCTLFEMGKAFSVEVLNKQNEIVGGLYGVCLGKYFCGESMFTIESNASKYGLIQLCATLKEHDIPFIDCQYRNPHLVSLGALPIPRSMFMKSIHFLQQQDFNLTNQLS